MEKVEGYWYSKRTPEYPMPVPYVLTEQQAEDVYKAIKEKEKIADEYFYRGSAGSRIDGSLVGSNEFSLDSWTWPGKFAEHYVLKYRVKPTDEFLKFLGITI
jgi:hypothetical protein